MRRLIDNFFNALLIVVVLAACSVAIHIWWQGPQVERVRVYRYAP